MSDTATIDEYRKIDCQQSANYQKALGQLDEAFAVIDFQAEIIETLNLRLIEAEKKLKAKKPAGE